MAQPITSLIPELQPYARALVDAAGAAGLQPRITSTRRSHAEQERLYSRYLAGQQAFYVAPPGTSPHEYGYAFDLVVAPFESLRDVGALWESWGGYWGGRQQDPVHFQYPGFAEWFRSQYGITPHQAAAAGGLDVAAIPSSYDYIPTPRQVIRYGLSPALALPEDVREVLAGVAGSTPIGTIAVGFSEIIDFLTSQDK